MSFRCSIRLLALSALALVLYFPLNAREHKRVILITIDGLRPDMVTDPLFPSPFMKMMKRDGIFVDEIIGVPPSSTYPSHTSIVTGVLPVEHGIFSNAPFMDNKDTVLVNWYADSIKAETLWQKASEAGLVTASLFWPVSTLSPYIDYNVPEFWSVAPVDDQLQFLKDYCTPKGIFEELEANATGVLNERNFWAGMLARDARTAYMANYLTDRYRPDLMTIHFIATDYAQHDDGLVSDRVLQAVASADNAVGLILEGLTRSGLRDSTVLIVCGDHGFAQVTKGIAPNVWLVQDGLLSPEPGGEWKACFHNAGAISYLYLNNSLSKKERQRVISRVEMLLESLPDSTRALFRTVGRNELKALGADPGAALAVEPVKGVTTLRNRSGQDVVPVSGGDHGYFSGYDRTACIIYGTSRKGQIIGSAPQTDIAPYVLFLLGLSDSCPESFL